MINFTGSADVNQIYENSVYHLSSILVNGRVRGIYFFLAFSFQGPLNSFVTKRLQSCVTRSQRPSGKSRVVLLLIDCLNCNVFIDEIFNCFCYFFVG